MQKTKWTSLWNALSAAGDLSGRFVFGAEASLALSDLVAGSALYGRGDELCGRSVLIATTNQLTTASTLIELDGIARRMILCPPDLPLEHLPYVIESANVDAIISDRTILGLDIPRPLCFCPCSRKIVPENCDRSTQHQTEWILLTSGTTGLTEAGRPYFIQPCRCYQRWRFFRRSRLFGVRSTTFAVTADSRYFFAPPLPGNRWCFRAREESTADFLARAGSHGVTHISGTPSQWRRALMSPSADLIRPNIFACQERSLIRQSLTICKLFIRKLESPTLSPRRRPAWRLT